MSQCYRDVRGIEEKKFKERERIGEQESQDGNEGTTEKRRKMEKNVLYILFVVEHVHKLWYIIVKSHGTLNDKRSVTIDVDIVDVK